MSAKIDTVLAWLKWPVAIAAVLLLPGSLTALFLLLGRAAVTWQVSLPLLLGAGLYMGLWWLARRRPAFGSFFSTLAHELTHALFALLTLHRVTGLRATWSRGGSMTVEGRGNWLITIGPYFFPSVCLIPAVALALVPQDYLLWVNLLMGATLAWYVTSMWEQTHPEQSDLRKVGLPFACMFLPTANTMALGSAIGLSHSGLSGLAGFLAEVFAQTFGLFAQVMQ